MIGGISDIHNSRIKPPVFKLAWQFSNPRDKLNFPKVNSSPVQLSFGCCVSVLLFSLIIELIPKRKLPLDDFAAMGGGVVHMGPLHASIFEQECFFVEHSLEEFVKELYDL